MQTLNGSCPIWGQRIIEEISRQLFEHIFEVEPLDKTAPGADAVKIALEGVGVIIAGMKIVEFTNNLTNMIVKAKDAAVAFITMGNNAEVAGGKIAATGTEAKTASVGLSGLLGLYGILLAGEPFVAQAIQVQQGPLQIQINQWKQQNPGQSLPPYLQQAAHDSGVPGYAAGGMNIPAGRYKVGEYGPEIMDIPGGSNIYPYGATPGGGGRAAHIHFEINGREIAYALVDDISEAQVRRIRMGTAVRR